MTRAAHNSAEANAAGFTAWEVARALGCTRQSVHQQLVGIPATLQLGRKGQLTRAWPLDALPPRMRQQLAPIADRKGYRSVSEFLAAPAQRYTPAVAFAKTTSTTRQKALLLRDALRQFIANRNTADASS